jgi:HSP20 family protein
MSLSERDLTRLQLEIREALQRMVDAVAPGVGVMGGLAPADVFDGADELVVVIEVPGLRADDLEVRASGATLEVSGVKPLRAIENGARALCLESASGTLRRRIDFDQPVNTHRATAVLSAGVLTLRVPKVKDQRSQPRLLTIQEVD